MWPPTLHRTIPVLALTLAACGGETNLGTSGDTLILEVDHYDAICEGNGPWFCPRVREVDRDESWRELPCDISDFHRKWGFRYTVEVSSFAKEEALHSCGTTGHELVEVLDESPVEAGTQFTREVRSYDLHVNDDGDISFVYNSLRCADPEVCSDLAQVITEDVNGAYTLVFEHATPGELPVLVRFSERAR